MREDEAALIVCDECFEGNHADCEGGDCECDCRDMRADEEDEEQGGA